MRGNSGGTSSSEPTLRGSGGRAGRAALPPVRDARPLDAGATSGRRGKPSDLSQSDFYHVDYHRKHDKYYDHHYPYYPYYPYYDRYHRHGHSHYSFGIYWGWPYAWAYPFRYSVYVGYPYVGYYSYYDYPYLDHYGCDFYSGYYVRFGGVGLSYYASCPHFGVHSYASHHSHYYACSSHGGHYYHVRDCALCYPDGVAYSGGVVENGAVAEAVEAAPVDAGPVEAAPAAVGGEEAVAFESIKRPLEPAFEGAPSGGAGSSAPSSDPLADLTPAKLTFALGLLTFRDGDYEAASEHFFNASIEDSESEIVTLMLAVSLVAIAEYDFAASFLRRSYEEPGVLDGAPIDLRRFYGEGREADFDAHVALLDQHLELEPSDADALLVRGFVALGGGDLDRAAVSLNAFIANAADPVDRALGVRLLASVQTRRGLALDGETPAVTGAEAEDGIAAPADDDPVRRFLATPGIDAVRALPIR